MVCLARIKSACENRLRAEFWRRTAFLFEERYGLLYLSNCGYSGARLWCVLLPKLRELQLEMTPYCFEVLKARAEGTGAHECGHMTVLFKAGRLKKLNYFPHKTALDGVPGVIESTTVTEPTKEDCVAFAASMIGELIALGKCDKKRLLDDREQVKRLANQPLENFALEAYEIIKQNLLFFALLNKEVGKKMLRFLDEISEGEHAAEDEVTIFTLAEVEEVYKRAESIVAGFPGKTEIQK